MTLEEFELKFRDSISELGNDLQVAVFESCIEPRQLQSITDAYTAIVTLVELFIESNRK